jgi:hypothetical protein
MARYNEILVGRYNRFLQKFLGIKGGPPAPQLATEVSPNLQLDDANYLENRWNQSWRSFGLGSVSPAVAAALSFFRISNLAGSGVIVVIEKAFVGSGTGANQDQLQLTRGPVGAVAGSIGAVRDLRISGGSAANLTTGSAAAFSGVSLWFANVKSFTTVDVILTQNQEIVLMPNDVLTFWGTTVNTPISAGFFWRERALEEGELV